MWYYYVLPNDLTHPQITYQPLPRKRAEPRQGFRRSLHLKNGPGSGRATRSVGFFRPNDGGAINQKPLE